MNFTSDKYANPNMMYKLSLYLIPEAGGEPVLTYQESTEIYGGIGWEDVGLYSLYIPKPDGTLAISLSGSVSKIEGEVNLPTVSPDGKWLLFSNPDPTAKYNLRLHDQEGKLEREFETGYVDNVLWRPDTKGIVFTSEGKIYTLEIPDGEPNLIDGPIRTNIVSPGYNLTWIQP